MRQAVMEGTAEKVVIVEGPDERRIFQALSEHLGLDGIQFIPAGSAERIRSGISAVLAAQQPMGILQSLGVVRDADENAENAFRSVCDSLAANGLPVPANALEVAAGVGDNPSAIALILPHGQSTGALEDVCLASIADDPMMPCIDDFMSCVEGTDRIDNHRRSSGNRAKTRLQAYLASRRPPKRRLGETGWNFDAPAFEPMRRFLTLL